MRDKPGVTLKPGLHIGMRVGTIVVHHQMQSDLAGEFRIQATQEFQKFLVAVAYIALANDFALQYLQGGE